MGCGGYGGDVFYGVQVGDFALLFDGQDCQTVGLATGTTGTTVTASTSSNVKGTWAAISTSTPIHAHGFLLHAGNPNNFNADNVMLDLGIGASGSEQVRVPNLFLSSCGASWSPGLDEFLFFFPLALPAGTRVSGRIQQADAGGYGGGTLDLSLHLLSQGWNASSPVGQVLALNATTANTTTTLLTSGGSGNSYGAWTQMVASTSVPLHALILTLGGNDTGQVLYYLDIGVGASGSEQVILPALRCARDNGTQRLGPRVLGPLPVSIPAGTRVSARLQASQASRSIYVGAYGLSN